MEINSTYYLYPATLYVSKEPILITTILGSCVAICLYDPILKIGGMNHFMLPLWNGSGLASPKFGNIAIDKLIEKCILSGSLKYNLKAKLFGGSDVLGEGKNMFNIGERNIETAFKILEDYQIPIISKHVGGVRGRKIRFNTFTGDVSVSLIAGASANLSISWFYTILKPIFPNSSTDWKINQFPSGIKGKKSWKIMK